MSVPIISSGFGAPLGYGYHYGSVAHVSSTDTELVVDNCSVSSTSDEVVLIDELFVTAFPSIVGSTSTNIQLTQQHTLSVQSCVVNSTSSDNVLIENAVLSVDPSLVESTSPEILVSTFSLLKTPHSSKVTTTSDRIRLIAHGSLTAHNSVVRSTSDLPRIIDWASYEVFFGGYPQKTIETGSFK